MTTIKLKNGSGAPAASDLVQGEPALDLTNKRLYTENASGTVIEVGTNPTSLTTGTFTSTGIDDNATSTAITIDASENVGIGSASPAAPLHVETSGNTAIQIRSGTTSYGNINFNDGATAKGQILYNHDGDYMRLYVNGAEAMRIDSSGKVGIGTDLPAVELEVASAAPQLRLTDTDGGYCEVANVSGNLLLQADKGDTQASSYMRFDVDGTERMRIDSNGQTMFSGSTAAFDNTGAVNGLQLHYTTTTGKGIIGTYSSGGSTSLAFRTNSVGAGASTDNMVIDSSGNVNISAVMSSTKVNSSATTGYLQVQGNDRYQWDDSRFYSANDNLRDLGIASYRWDDVYATNGTIQTSDANEKQDIEALSEAETRVAVAAKGLLRKFRWKSAVEEKGDDARIHFGIIAQDLQAAFEAEGLDAGRYAMFIHSTWTDEETNEERSRMGVRYSELLAFIIAAI